MNPNPVLRWSYWAIICAALIAGLAGLSEAFWLAVAVSTLQLLHYRWSRGSFADFAVQVRAAYLAMMLLDLAWAPMRWHLWVMAGSTLVLVLSGWCMLSRIMALMPWNRSQALSWDLLRQIFLSGPASGSILEGLGAPATPHSVPDRAAAS